nr:MAG TPA: hypothetical protein [Caudoviricetes sp.]
MIDFLAQNSNYFKNSIHFKIQIIIIYTISRSKI